MLRKLLFFPPVLLGAAIVWWLAGNRQPPEVVPKQEEIRSVRIIQAKSASVVPKVIGFGEVRPGKVWKGVAQVAGEVTFVHPSLQRGAIMSRGTEVIRISTRDFDLAIAQAEANIRAVDAQLAELEVSRQNTTASLEIEREALAIREGELARKQKLVASGTVSRTSFDQETRDTLSQRKKVLDLENSLKLNPAKKAALVEQKKVNLVLLEQAKTNLSRTRISLPFDARIGEVSVEVAQYAQTGSTLVSADSIDVSEVEAQIPFTQFRAVANAATPSGISGGVSPENIPAILKQFGFSATIRLIDSNAPVEWKARFSRISDTIDPKTRSIGIIVAADDTYSKAVPGKKPPLSRGMFVEVELRSRTLEGRIALPRSAIHHDNVYLVTKENRLKIVPVERGIAQGDAVIVRSGVSAGDRVVVSDLLPAIEGMLLRVTHDTALEEKISRQLAETGR